MTKAQLEKATSLRLTRFGLFKLDCARREALDGAIFGMLTSDMRQSKKLTCETVLAGK
jgi:hypothetical protein